MKELTSYRRCTQQLNKIFKLVSKEYFNDELEEVQVTLQESKGTYGHLTLAPIWVTDEGKATRELNISAQWLDRPIEAIVTTVIHEGSHLWNLQHGIKDTSGSSHAYHNKFFKKTAEELGKIKISHDSKYGWTVSEPTEATLDFIIKYELSDFKIARADKFNLGGFSGGASGNGAPKPIDTTKKKTSWLWCCPKCGQKARTGKANAKLICGECMERMIEK